MVLSIDPVSQALLHSLARRACRGGGTPCNKLPLLCLAGTEQRSNLKWRSFNGSSKRLERRMEALQRVKEKGFEIVISKLEVVFDYLRRAPRGTWRSEVAA